MNTLNRRKFLSSSALLATSSLISVTANAACKDPMPAKWDEEVDVIVVGSGFAGLAAAAEAKNANAGNVIVLEKMRAPGGNSVINGGIFAVPGNPAQVKLGIKDSPELLASDMIAAGLGYGYPEKIKAMTEEALPTYEWTVKELGVQYNDKVGHSVPRHVSAIETSFDPFDRGSSFTKKFRRTIRVRLDKGFTVFIPMSEKVFDFRLVSGANPVQFVLNEAFVGFNRDNERSRSHKFDSVIFQQQRGFILQ